MNIASTITFSIDPEIKKKAQEKAQRQGFKFDFFVKSVVNELAKTYVREDNAKSYITIRVATPSDYFNKTLKKARENRKAGKGSPIFDNSKDYIKWLEDQGI